jgi:anti-anti-sigma factor
MDADRIKGGRDGDACCVHIRGRATAHQTTELRDFVFESLRRGARRVKFFLADCHYGDSTFLGTLLQCRQATQALGPDALILVDPTQELVQTLRAMGLLRLFRTHAEPLPDDIHWQTLSADPPGRCSREFCENVAVAHRMLADSTDEGRQRYEQIARAAEEELARRPTSGT